MTCVFDSYNTDGNDFDYVMAWKEIGSCIACGKEKMCIRFEDQHRHLRQLAICKDCFNNCWDENDMG